MENNNFFLSRYYQISILAILLILILFGLITLLKNNISGADKTLQDNHLPEVIY